MYTYIQTHIYMVIEKYISIICIDEDTIIL